MRSPPFKDSLSSQLLHLAGYDSSHLLFMFLELCRKKVLLSYNFSVFRAQNHKRCCLREIYKLNGCDTLELGQEQLSKLF